MNHQRKHRLLEKLAETASERGFREAAERSEGGSNAPGFDFSEERPTFFGAARLRRPKKTTEGWAQALKKKPGLGYRVNWRDPAQSELAQKGEYTPPMDRRAPLHQRISHPDVEADQESLTDVAGARNKYQQHLDAKARAESELGWAAARDNPNSPVTVSWPSGPQGPKVGDEAPWYSKLNPLPPTLGGQVGDFVEQPTDSRMQPTPEGTASWYRQRGTPEGDLQRGLARSGVVQRLTRLLESSPLNPERLAQTGDAIRDFIQPGAASRMRSMRLAHTLGDPRTGDAGSRNRGEMRKFLGYGERSGLGSQRYTIPPRADWPQERSSSLVRGGGQRGVEDMGRRMSYPVSEKELREKGLAGLLERGQGLGRG